MKKSTKNGFTLAEVLITLGIIGIVAAITIPTLIMKQEKAVILSQLKKSYAMLQTMYASAIQENGPIDSWGWDTAQNYDDTTLDRVVQEIFAPSLKVAKYCDAVTNVANDQCWAIGTYKDGDVFNIWGSNAALLLDDGSSVCFQSFQPNAARLILYITTDVNGFKGPNTMGKDRFYFVVDTGTTNGKLAPWGTGQVFPPDRDACWNTGAYTGGAGGAGNGWFCSYTIIVYDNWQIAGDYVW